MTRKACRLSAHPQFTHYLFRNNINEIPMMSGFCKSTKKSGKGKINKRHTSGYALHIPNYIR